MERVISLVREKIRDGGSKRNYELGADSSISNLFQNILIVTLTMVSSYTVYHQSHFYTTTML